MELGGATKSSNVLDACNGRTQPDGTYGYHATTDFPYLIGCFTGTATLPTGRASEPMPPMGGQQPPMGGQQPPMGGQQPPMGGQQPPMGAPPKP